MDVHFPVSSFSSILKTWAPKFTLTQPNYQLVCWTTFFTCPVYKRGAISPEKGAKGVLCLRNSFSHTFLVYMSFSSYRHPWTYFSTHFVTLTISTFIQHQIWNFINYVTNSNYFLPLTIKQTFWPGMFHRQKSCQIVFVN